MLTRLGETVATLARRRGPSLNDPRSEMAHTSNFGPNPGQLRMLSYCPRTLERAAPLVVVLHGCTQDASSFVRQTGWLTLADRQGFAILAPEQVAANNPNRCFNWFSPQDATRNNDEAASIAAMIASMVAMHHLDRTRVFITGLSAGGAMTLTMLAEYPELFAAGAVIAGLPHGVAHDVVQAMTAMRQCDPRSHKELARLIPHTSGRRPRLSVWHGSSDHVVSAANAEAIAGQWAIAQGLSHGADEIRRTSLRSCRTWKSDDGNAALELHLVTGLGHGVPLSTRGSSGIGETGAYMLEAGISSSEEIADFFGLAVSVGSDRRVETQSWDEAPLQQAPTRIIADLGSAKPKLTLVGDQVMASVVGCGDSLNVVYADRFEWPLMFRVSRG